MAASRSIPSLREAIEKKASGIFAYCPGCKMIYIDDCSVYGSIICPNCSRFALLRGVEVIWDKDIPATVIMNGRVEA